ncbi:5-methylcytosine-specific restriction protein A [Pseudomonas sp. BT76 TE3572]|uniref:HNH endonuclease n=1 Tax=Pseudomonas sp. BT76 TE3572 TaxID=3349325 RepID=UPI003D23A32C
MLSDLREQLKPTSTMRVYDAVSEAGIDVSDWHNISSNRSPAQNPNYCYRWAFQGNDRVLVCLWYDELDFLANGVEYRGNARAEYKTYDERANDQRAPSLKQRLKTWAARALQMDVVVKIAHWEDRLVRVALVQSKSLVRRDDERAAADFRLLDSEPWHLVQYDMQTGAFLLRRGPKPLHETLKDIVVFGEEEGAASGAPSQAFPEITPDSYGVGVADQFIGNETPERTAVSAFVWGRSAKVRQVVLARSKGCCEHCGRLGFLKVNGEIYIETHHVVPLSEEGADTPGNVIALCPEHHREAHFGSEHEALKASFLQMLVAVGA